MLFDDREVLEFLGRQGKSADAITQRFPDFDIRRLIRAGLIEERLKVAETQAHGRESSGLIRHYVLSYRGANAVGIDPLTPGLT